MFQRIDHIDQIRLAVAHKKEIRFHQQPNGVTIGCYMFRDSDTFDTPEALECRGIGFDTTGAVCSRPLHKFFNVGEAPHVSIDKVRARQDVVAIYDKLDGSMLVTAWVNGGLQWRSKMKFGTDVVKLLEAFLALDENAHIQAFSEDVARQGLTAVFELTHPQMRIVVAADKPAVRLLHVRDNLTGEYVLLNPAHPIHELADSYGIEKVRQLPIVPLDDLMSSMRDMTNAEGYVIQFSDGDMVKLKCPWYLRLHKGITFLSERNIAVSALADELDDLKALLAEAGIALDQVEKVETRVKDDLMRIESEIDAVLTTCPDMDMKTFAAVHREHPYFGLMTAKRQGKQMRLVDWFTRNRLKQSYSTTPMVNDALMEALQG